MDYSDYKKYSLENLENWMHDAMSAGEATPQEIYDVIVGVVKENYYIYKQQVSQAYELLSLLNSGVDNNKYQNHLNKILSCDKDDSSEECKKSWTSFWEENSYSQESSQYTEEEMNAMCDKAASDQEKEKCREYNLREAEYYNKRAELDLNPGPQQKYIGWNEVSQSDFDKMFPSKEKSKIPIKEEISRNDPNRLDYREGLIYESPDGGKTVYARKPGETERTLVKQEKINKWIVPIEVDGPNGEYFLTLPSDLLEAANLEEGDTIEWIEQKDGSYILRKTHSLMYHPV